MSTRSGFNVQLNDRQREAMEKMKSLLNTDEGGVLSRALSLLEYAVVKKRVKEVTIEDEEGEKETIQID